MSKSSWQPGVLAAVLIAAGCKTEHRVIIDPVEFKPMHLTVDVNIRVQRELEEFFDFEQTFSDETPAAEASDDQP